MSGSLIVLRSLIEVNPLRGKVYYTGAENTVVVWPQSMPIYLAISDITMDQYALEQHSIAEYDMMM